MVMVREIVPCTLSAGVLLLSVFVNSSGLVCVKQHKYKMLTPKHPVYSNVSYCHVPCWLFLTALWQQFSAGFLHVMYTSKPIKEPTIACANH